MLRGESSVNLQIYCGSRVFIARNYVQDVEIYVVDAMDVLEQLNA